MTLMRIQNLQTGSVFYYTTHTLHDNKTHRHKCRVLFVGTKSIYYDAWWEGLNQWTFVPVKKRLSYYIFPLSHVEKLSFDGFEPIAGADMQKLFLECPEIILDVEKKDFNTLAPGKELIASLPPKIAFIPKGPKGGWTKHVYFECGCWTSEELIKNIHAVQNIDFIASDRITVQRIGLHGGFPSYCIID